ncbi:unnamed protein product [Parnassius apollo]|uniref:(apollo) hypothetical protein n=1 Tax=Parnassius apollo TaxID=110799 RepID=A0A8S3X785_PARAO|nr:unnamed protein product [Parnassius apollo]
MCSNRTRKILQLLQPIPDESLTTDEQLNSQTLRLVSIETVIREERCSSPLTKEQLQFFENHANEENFQYCLRELSRESPVSMLSREDSPSVLHSRESSHSLLNSQENDPYETDADSSSNWSPSPRVRKNPRLTVISSTSDSSESNVDENVNNKRKSRKRLRDQKNWKREIAKTKRLAGESNDTCDTCDKFISLLKHETNPEEREKIEKQRKEHIEDADKSDDQISAYIAYLVGNESEDGAEEDESEENDEEVQTYRDRADQLRILEDEREEDEESPTLEQESSGPDPAEKDPTLLEDPQPEQKPGVHSVQARRQEMRKLLWKKQNMWTTEDDVAFLGSLDYVKGGSTTNLKKHLMKKHRSSYETIIPCSMSDEAVLEAPIPSTSASTESTNPVIKKSETISQQTKLSAFIKRPVGVVREKKINDLIFKMIVKDLQPFSVIEDAGFKDLINYLEPVQTNRLPNNKLPNPKLYMKKTIARGSYEEHMTTYDGTDVSVTMWKDHKVTMGRIKGARYQCITKRKKNKTGLAYARQILAKRNSNTNSSLEHNKEDNGMKLINTYKNSVVPNVEEVQSDMINTCQEITNALGVNHSAVSDIISIGCGRANLNELAASINLPLISKCTYHKCHDDLYNWWKTTAESSMIEAGKDEANMALEKGSVSPSGIPSISVTADGAWGKRSHKTKFTSATSVAAIISLNTGKILHVGIENKYCTMCSRAAHKNKTPPDHQCNATHTGSSASMEKSIIVE